MKKVLLQLLVLSVLGLAPWACKPYPLLPIPSPAGPSTSTPTFTNTPVLSPTITVTPTNTSTSTSTPTANLAFTSTATPTITSTSTPFPPVGTQTFVSTPGCGFTTVTVATPIVPASPFYPSLTPLPTPTNNYPLMGQNLVIRSLADWQAYYGSTSAPAPPVDFNSQMLIINLGVVNGNTIAGGGTFVPINPSIQSVCWDNNQITISCTLFLKGTCGPIQITPGLTPTPPNWIYAPTAVVVPLSNLPAFWNVTIITMGCPAL